MLIGLVKKSGIRLPLVKNKKMFKKIKAQIERKRYSDNLIWKSLIRIKDFVWTAVYLRFFIYTYKEKMLFFLVQVLYSLGYYKKINQKIMGIFTVFDPLCPFWRDYKKELNFFANIIKRNEQNLLVCIFLPQFVDFKRKFMIARVYKNNRWKRKLLPLPDSVQIEIFLTKLSEPQQHIITNLSESRKILKIKKDQLIKSNIPQSNPIEFLHVIDDKYTFAQLMKKHKINHPETRMCNQQNITEMCQKYNVLYIKPRFGGGGEGIIIAEKDKFGNFTLTYKKPVNDGWKNKSVFNVFVDEIGDKIKAIKYDLKIENFSYIVQQGINIYEFKNKKTSVRTMFQRDIKGRLVRTLFCPHIGGNLSTGGKPILLDILLDSLSKKFKINKSKIKKDILDECHKVIKIVEKCSDKKFGQTGIDLIFDKKGKLILLELNSRVGRTPLQLLIKDLKITKQREFYEKELDRSYKLLTEYGYYLTGK